MTDTLAALLDATAARFPEHEAIAYAPAGTVTVRRSWRELRAASRDAAKRLAGLGVGKGTRVALLCSNRPEWLPLAFGAARLGALLVPLSTLWKRDELAYALRHADVSVLLTLPRFLRHDYVAALAAIVPSLASAEPGRLHAAELPALRRVVLIEGDAPGCERWDDLPAALDDAGLDGLEAGVSPLDPAVVFFTSGTTAQAKAVVQSHRALTISGRRVSECLGIGPEDAWWGHMPLFWSGGFVIGALTTIAGGGRIVLQEVVEPGPALALLEAERCTIMLGWHQAAPLLEHPDFPRRRLFLKKGSGGTHPLAPRLLGADHVSVGMYGMTETATCITCGRWDDPEPIRTGTFGRPLAGMELRIVDPETGRPVAPGESGEILVRGPTLMEGYLRVPHEDTFDPEGFFRTGDLGRLDEAGCLHFATRLKDVIKTAGVNVAANEVEEALARHPAVRSAHVVGVADAARGENVAAFVVLRPEADADAETLRAFCRESLASYKVPRHVFVIADGELPRTATGKIEKAALRRTAEARVAASRDR
ncbi:MAG TPA: AMP-binding protein [Candidatus Binatia bacterium]|nr:AMP-binding protein [Candidatus Binatia bacterium]